ncbi:signal peptidase II [Aeromicrobium sp. CF3.5]|uniref:signal peptidase II n=1 Tax=Aeromicrobium sp. CF3.5 TaxID=3373078 RepID=UPI003EE768A1
MGRWRGIATQDAWGAPLSPQGEPAITEPTESSAAPRSAAPNSAVRLFVVVATVVLVIDQVTKVLAVEFLEGEPSSTLIPGLLDLTFLRNPGAAFGQGSSMTIVLTLIAIVVAAVVVRMAARLRDRGWAVGLGLLLAGAVGNLVDRLFREPEPLRGQVVDFIDYGPFVGNVADIALTVAAVVIVWRTVRGVAIDGTKETR